MTTSDTPAEDHEVVANIKKMIAESNVNDNQFYHTFKMRRLDPETMKTVFQQYYYYIRTFPRILAGTSHNVESELIRMKLARTVVSELGDNIGEPHFKMFERVLKSVGVTLDDWRTAKHIPEAVALVDGLRRLFLKEPTNYAIGAHYVIEDIGMPMIIALYEGFRPYKGWTAEDFNYFYLHMLVETEHVEWIRDAVIEAARSGEDAIREIQDGARQVIDLLNGFWSGLNRVALTVAPSLAAE
jgi:pyrroloquinoline-quinone synthase